MDFPGIDDVISIARAPHARPARLPEPGGPTRQRPCIGAVSGWALLALAAATVPATALAASTAATTATATRSATAPAATTPSREASTASAPDADAPLAPDTPAFRNAQARQQDAETVTALTADARILLQRDRVKLNGYDYCSIAVAAAERGDFRTSIEAASRALLMGQTEDNPDLAAVARRDLALAYSYAGDLDSAERYAREALASRPINPSKVYAPAHKILGDVALRRQDPQAAIAAYRQALDTASDRFRQLVLVSLANAHITAGDPAAARTALAQAGAPDGASMAAIHRRIEGNLLLAENRPRDAIRAFEAARDAAVADRGDGNYDRLWANEGLGRAWLAQGNPAQARTAFGAAVDDAEHIRARFRSDEFKTGLFADAQTVYEQAIGLAAAAGDFEAAWALSERSRSRALLDVVRDRVDGTPDDTRIGGGVLPLAAVQAQLRPGEAIVQYHSLDDALVVWVLRADGLSGQRLPINRPDLELAVEDFRNAIIKRRRSALTFGHTLDRLLIAPLALRPHEQLVIVPHGALHYLPFQALRNDDAFLIQRHALAQAPSATIGAQLVGQGRTVASSLVAFGNPDIAPEYTLPAAEREVNNIAPLFARQHTYLRAEANRTRFTQHAAQGQILHLATHAEADTIDPMHSRILLAPQAGTAAAPDLMLARDIFNLDLGDVALVTLSACETGLGRIARGDEILGFTRAFFYAGASSLIVSLWPVADESSERLMSTFYGHLTRGEPAITAMRDAQLAVLNTQGFAHPFFWAPFDLMGNWRLTLAARQP